MTEQCEFCRMVCKPGIPAKYLACFEGSGNIIPMCALCVAKTRAHPEDGMLAWVRSI